MCGAGQISEDYSVSDQQCMGEEGGKGGWKICNLDSNCFYTSIFSDTQTYYDCSILPYTVMNCKMNLKKILE